MHLRTSFTVMNADQDHLAANARECTRIQKPAKAKQKPKSNSEARKHGEDQNQFSPQKAQRGTEENWKTKNLPQRAQRGSKAIKFGQKTKKFAISNTEARGKIKTFSPLIFADKR